MINTPKSNDEVLKLRLEGLTDEQKDQLFELLMQDKKLRENKKEWGPEKLINSELKYFDKIISKLEPLQKGVYLSLKNPEKWIYNNSFIHLLNWAQDTLDEINYLKDEYRSKKDISSDEIKADIINLLQHWYGLGRSGWINRLMIFLSYSRIPNIKEQMKEHWIDVTLLEEIWSDVKEMLNEIGMEFIIPSVLTDAFDKNLFEYKNSDTKISVFFPDISVRDYKWFIFDISEVGYTIEDKDGNIIDSKKPVVYYN